jgi:hypothetical protein
VLLGRGLCDGPIPRPEESYRLRCVSECDQMKLQKTSTTAVNKWVEEGRTTNRNRSASFSHISLLLFYGPSLFAFYLTIS